jgi:hypothetical protein
MVALDAGEPRLHAPSAAWTRLKRGAEQQGTAVLVTSARRLQGALGACAVTLSRAQPRFDGPPLLVGLETQAAVERGGEETAERPRIELGLPQE